jgi:hypothetical protein
MLKKNSFYQAAYKKLFIIEKWSNGV